MPTRAYSRSAHSFSKLQGLQQDVGRITQEQKTRLLPPSAGDPRGLPTAKLKGTLEKTHTHTTKLQMLPIYIVPISVSFLQEFSQPILEDFSLKKKLLW